MNMKIQKIADAEIQIGKLVTEEKKKRREYLADGTIDAKEQKQLDGVTDKMGKLKGAVARIRAEIEVARRAWESRATDWAQAKADIADLAAWGHADHAKVKAEADKIDPMAKDEQWEEATKQLDVLLKALMPVMTDYEAQVAAKAEYDPLRKDSDARVRRLEAADPQTPDLEAMRTDLSTGLDAAGKSAASKGFVAGLKSVQAMQPDLDAAEVVARDARTQKAEFDKEWASAGPRVTEAVSCVPPEAGDLDGKRKGLETGKSQIEEMLTRHDYAAATLLSKDLGARSDAYMAEYAAVVDAKTLYEKRLPRIAAKLAEIAKCQFPDLTSLQEDIVGTDEVMRGAAGAGGYDQALKGMDKLDALLVKFDEAYEIAKLGKDFADRKARLSPRIDKAKVSGFGPVDDLSNALTSDADAADKAAAGKKYPEALALLDDVEVKLGDYEAKRDAQEKARADYENGAPQLLERSLDLGRSEFPQLAEKTSTIVALTDQMKTAAEKRDFVVASEHMFKLEKELSVVETTLDMLRARQTEYETRLPPLLSRFDGEMVSDFAQLEDERDALLTARADMESAAKNRDFSLAVDHMNKVENLLNNLASQRGTIEGLKKQYEDILARIEAQLKRAGDCAYEELATKKAAIVALRTEMLATAQEEDFAVALQKATALIPLLNEFDKMEALVATYREHLEKLKPQLATIKAYTYKSLKKKQDEIATAFTEMTATAAKGEMSTALTQMGKLEKLAADTIALHTELFRQEAVYQKLSGDLAARMVVVEASKKREDALGKAATEAIAARDKLKELGDKHEFIEAVAQADVVSAKIDAFEKAVNDIGDAKEAYEILAKLALAGYADAKKQSDEYEDLKNDLIPVTKAKTAMEEAAKGDTPNWEDAKTKANALLAALDTFRGAYMKNTNREAAVRAAADAAKDRFKALPEDAKKKAEGAWDDAEDAIADLDEALKQKKLERAEEKVAALNKAIEQIESAQKTKEQHKADYDARLATLMPRVEKAPDSKFAKALVEELKAVTAALKAMTDLAADEDYEGGSKAAPALEKALADFDAAEEKLKPLDATLTERFVEIDTDMKIIDAEIAKLDLVNQARFTVRSDAMKSKYAEAKTKRAEIMLAEAGDISKQVRKDQRTLLAEIEKLEDDAAQAEKQKEKDKTTLDKVLEVGEEVVDKVVDKAIDVAWDEVDSRIKGGKNIGKGVVEIVTGDPIDGAIDVVKGVDEAVGLSKNVKRGVKVAEEVYDVIKDVF